VWFRLDDGVLVHDFFRSGVWRGLTFAKKGNGRVSERANFLFHNAKAHPPGITSPDD
jgi:hypothetical protein